MSKYIDQDALCEFARHSTIGIDANDIMRFPTADVVEVLRCKDCVYCNKEKVYHRVTTDDLDYKEYYRCNRSMWYFSPDDFCSYGERRESK